jgi:hypothetical protein
MVWIDPTDIPQSSAASCSVNHRFERMTARTRWMELLSLKLRLPWMWIIFDRCLKALESSLPLVGCRTIHTLISKHFLQHLKSLGGSFSQLKRINAHMLFVWTLHFRVSLNITDTCLCEDVLHVDWTRYGNDSSHATDKGALYQPQFAGYRCPVAFAYGTESSEPFWTDYVEMFIRCTHFNIYCTAQCTLLNFWTS